MMLKLFLILSLFFTSLRFAFVPTVVIDASDRVAPVSSRASGYLYGMAEAGVPSDLMADSLSVSSVSQKVTDGLQHPTGDIDHVAGALGNADYLVVYLQDCFSTWYYENDRIVEERKAGTYDPQAFLENDYFPQVKASLEKLAAAPYADRVVCCLYNECDNGVWFGETRREGDNVWGDFSETGRDTFFDAWRQTYELVRSLAPELKIGGPGYYEYSAAKERDFLTYCAENGCVPDVMIWHELGELSSYDWEDHVNEYRAMEAELGIDPLPVIVTEYGTMAECGNPANMLEYVCAIERSGVYGDIAFWRLADNFNDNAADDNMPNACWWLYRWYAGMEGDWLGQEKCDLFHGDFEKAVKAGRPMKFRDFDALAALNGSGDRLEILCGDCDHSGQLVVKRLDKTALGKHVRVRVEEVVYQGLTGEVTRPLTLRDENVCAVGGTLRIPLKDMTEGSVYHVILTPASDSHDPVDVRPVRYEAEAGELLGDAYTYDSAYASTGQQSGMVGGMEKEGDGVKLTVAAPKAGDYTLTIIYGKHNDGSGPAGRVNGAAKLLVNGDPMTLTLPNTIKSEYTDCLTRTVTLKKGKNELTFLHEDGTFVLDSVLLTPVSAGQTDAGKLAVMPYRADSGAAFLTVAPADGCYPVFCDIAALTVDGAKAAGFVSGDRVYLRRGLNLLTAAEETARCEIGADGVPVENVIPASEMTVAAPAEVTEGVLSGIASSGGSASFPFAAPVAGDYRVTLCYSNNQEGGYHAYNVDLIEAYFTVSVNGETRQVMCRNTYSDETFSTVTFNVTLPEGESVFTLSNDGSIRFDGRETAAPLLRWAAISPVVTSSASGR